MAAHLDDQIVALLGDERAEVLAQALAYGARFRCPACGRVGDSTVETGVVLYYRMGMAGGYSGETSSEGWRPDEPALVRWWPARVHDSCRLAAVQPWSDAPSWARPSRPGDVETAALIGDGVGTWSSAVTPTGVPVLRCDLAAPTGQVELADYGSGDWRERLVELTTAEMRVRWASMLTEQDLVADAVGDLWRLNDWYAQVSAGAVDIWMPAPVWAGPAAGRDRLRRHLGTAAGLPAAWLDTVRRQGRLVLIVAAPPILRTVTGAGVSGWHHDIPRVGGMIAAGPAPDHDRHTTVPGVADPGSRRSPVPAGRSMAADRRVGPIDVEHLWAAALRRAAPIADSHDSHAHRGTQASTEAIALVLAGLCRQDDAAPHEVPLAALARRFAGHDLDAWLNIMIGPTSLRDRLDTARHGGPPVTMITATWDSWRFTLRHAQQAVVRQWLLAAGGLRIGDQVRELAVGRPGGSPARCGRITDLSPITWPSAGTSLEAVSYFDIAVGTALPAPVAEHDLLLADDSDPRALEQAAYTGARHLWLYQQVMSDQGCGAAERREVLRARYTDHSIAPVRAILREISTAPGHHLSAALTTAINHLTALAPRHRLPGGILAHD